MNDNAEHSESDYNNAPEGYSIYRLIVAMQRQTHKTVEKTASKEVLPSKNTIKVGFAFIKVVAFIRKCWR